jgi:hypothetical protein
VVPPPLHLARRFFGALDPRGPSETDEAWVAEQLGEGEQELWARMSGPDRRHALGVARAVAATPEGQQPWVVAAALLHDVGKVDSQLSTVARVPATVLGLVARERLAGGSHRLARYLRHDAIGADLLERADADPRTVAWAREHHLPPERWTVPRRAGDVLKAADDD